MSHPQSHRVEADLGDGRKFVFESGWIAKQVQRRLHGHARRDDGPRRPRSPDPAREGTDFFPLTIDYREKMAAAGRFPGGFIKREAPDHQGDPDLAPLTDRPCGRSGPTAYFMDVQVQLNVYSADQVNDPDIVAMNAASASLMVSDLPLPGPGRLGPHRPDRRTASSSARPPRRSRRAGWTS